MTTVAGPLAPYDAVLLVSFGGPERPEEVTPFLESVTRGKGIPASRLADVARHYLDRGGRSPINDENRALLAALRAELAARGVEAPLLWGNRNAPPWIADALDQARRHGAQRVVALLTSAYPSYPSCRQYREDLAAARAGLPGGGAELSVDKVRPFDAHRGFQRANARLAASATAQLLRRGGVRPETTRLVFVTHSLPVAMDERSGPPDAPRSYSGRHQLLAQWLTAQVSAQVGARLGGSLAYCSRSGPPTQPWLEPDVNDHLAALAAEGAEAVVLVPFGFVADHMEVVHDLDTEAMATAARLGLAATRAPTARSDAEFVTGLADLLLERAAEARGEAIPSAAPGPLAPLPSVCADGCCPNPRGDPPALCGAGR